MFIEEKARLRERKPENHYRFFPVEYEDWTWVRNEDSIADGYTDRWMGNDTRRGPNKLQDTRCDNGWGRPLGQGTQRTTDTWTPRMMDSWVPGDRQRTDAYRRRSTERGKSREQNTRNRDSQHQSSRSRSRGRTSQQQPQKETSPRQRSIIPWVTQKDKTGEGSSRDSTNMERRQNETEYRSTQPSRK